ncbi:MOSC domain-containing protein [Virgibacillus proomii]|jgi:MOSC domain-containing protein YiiM|uniref:MOSC domain-containing protein n=1 Tax=Virgibacillus proomii TaxID=84407 RepID=UPI00098511FD|nr:MOSC domain-containing protein [Virgibacillus proomii]
MEEPYIYKLFLHKVKGNTESASEKKEWVTEEVEESIWLAANGLIGDEKEQPKLDQALFAYPFKHYYSWVEEMQFASIPSGYVGENLSVLEMDEYSVFIGDTYRVGDAVIQVTQPYLPTWKLAQRFQVEDFALRMQRSGRTGWHFRVIEEGEIRADQDIKLLDRPYSQWSIAACNEIMHILKEDLRLADDLLQCPVLGKTWKHLLTKRLRGIPLQTKKRLFGPNI